MTNNYYVDENAAREAIFNLDEQVYLLVKSYKKATEVKYRVFMKV